MKSILPLFAFLLFTTNVFANQIADQKWTCVLNPLKSRQALNAAFRTNPGRRDGSRGATQTSLSTVATIAIDVKNGQITDGQITGAEGFDESGWRFTEPSPQERNAQEYSLTQLQNSRDGQLRFEVGSHGWDHFQYRFSINPATDSATVSEYGYFDCGSPGAGVGVFDCERQK